MKLKKILSEILPKQKWVRLDASTLLKHKVDIFDIIKSTYAPIGGHPDFKSVGDINLSDLTFWLGTDLDIDPDVDAVMAGKYKNGNLKLTVGAQDGSPDARKAMVKMLIARLRTPGNYTEASHKPAELFVSSGIKYETDPEIIQKVLGKEIQYVGDGWYIRNIGGTPQKKRLFGVLK